MKASHRWPKEDLVRLAVEMLRYGYELPNEELLPFYSKSDLAYMVNNAERPDVIWGVNVNEVEIDKQPWQWVLKKPNGRKLATVSFTDAYEWQQGSHGKDYLAALEACLVEAPLTAEDRARLEEKRPGITSKPLFEVDHDAWEIEDAPEPWEPPAAPEPEPAKAPDAAPRPLSPKRKIRL